MVKNDKIYLQLLQEMPEDKYRDYVPALNFAIVSKADNNYVGRCVLRVGHNKKTFFGGNIGYFVNEMYRGHRYAYYACLELLEIAARKGLAYVLITCNPDNIASRRTCELLNGEFLGEFSLPDDSEMRLKGELSKLIYRVNV